VIAAAASAAAGSARAMAAPGSPPPAVPEVVELLAAGLSGAGAAERRAAAAAALVEALRGRRVTLLAIVAGLQAPLTTEDPDDRLAATALLAELTAGAGGALPAGDVAHLAAFFAGRLGDYPCIAAAAAGAAALLGGGALGAEDALRLVRALAADGAVQSLPQRERHACLTAWLAGLRAHGAAAAAAGVDVLDATIAAIDGEKDPRCLALGFAAAAAAAAAAGAPGADAERLAAGAAELVDVLAAYFPIAFKPPPNDPHGITREGLAAGLAAALAASPALAPHAMPLLFEKLSSARREAKLDALAALPACVATYASAGAGGAAGGGMEPHTPALWLALRQELTAAAEAAADAPPGGGPPAWRPLRDAAAACATRCAAALAAAATGATYGAATGGPLVAAALRDPVISEDLPLNLDHVGAVDEAGARAGRVQGQVASAAAALAALAASSPAACAAACDTAGAAAAGRLARALPEGGGDVAALPPAELATACGALAVADGLLGAAAGHADWRAAGGGDLAAGVLRALRGLRFPAAGGDAADAADALSGWGAQLRLWNLRLWARLLGLPPAAGALSAGDVCAALAALAAACLSGGAGGDAGGSGDEPLEMAMAWGEASTPAAEAARAVQAAVGGWPEAAWRAPLGAALGAALAGGPAAGAGALALAATVSECGPDGARAAVQWLLPAAAGGLALGAPAPPAAATLALAERCFACLADVIAPRWSPPVGDAAAGEVCALVAAACGGGAPSGLPEAAAARLAGPAARALAALLARIPDGEPAKTAALRAACEGLATARAAASASAAGAPPPPAGAAGLAVAACAAALTSASPAAAAALDGGALAEALGAAATWGHLPAAACDAAAAAAAALLARAADEPSAERQRSALLACACGGGAGGSGAPTTPQQWRLAALLARALCMRGHAGAAALIASAAEALRAAAVGGGGGSGGSGQLLGAAAFFGAVASDAVPGSALQPAGGRILWQQRAFVACLRALDAAGPPPPAPAAAAPGAPPPPPAGPMPPHLAARLGEVFLLAHAPAKALRAEAPAIGSRLAGALDAALAAAPALGPAAAAPLLLGLAARAEELVAEPGRSGPLHESVDALLAALCALARWPGGAAPREAALRVLAAAHEALPYHLLHPHRRTVLAAVAGALDDDRRAVRAAAVRARRAWQPR